MRNIRRKTVLLSSVAFLALTVGTWTVSYPVPLPLVDEELAMVQTGAVPLVLGFRGSEPPTVYEVRAFSLLVRSNLFTEVVWLNGDVQDEQVDVIVEVSRTVGGSNTIPVWTFITLGWIPTVMEESWYDYVDFVPPGGNGEVCRLGYGFSGTTVLGGWARVRNVGRGFSSRSPREHDEYAKRFALALVKSREQIMFCAGQ